MKVRFEAAFEKDLRRIDDRKVLQKLKSVIEEVKAANETSSVNNLKKLRGYDIFYRIKTGDYKIGIEIVEAEFISVRFLHRKEVYRYFP